MANFIIFIVFVSILGLLISGALSMYIAGEKGISTTKGFIIGISFPIIGIVWVALMKSSDKQIARDMYDRNMLTRRKLDQTVEFKKEN